MVRNCPNVLITLLAPLCACTVHTTPVATTPVTLHGPTLAQTTQIATHNSYWVNHGVLDLGAGGVGETIFDQLMHDGVRSLELDVHPDPATPHHFLVYHTVPGNGVCTDLFSCLAPHRNYWLGEALIVILELKGITGPTFDALHTPEDLDAEIRKASPDNFIPKDLFNMQGCARALTLAQCVQTKGWPRETNLANTGIFAVLGNWDSLPGAVAPADWALYATGQPILARWAFPMGSSWQRDYTTLSDDNRAKVSAAQWEAAWQQTVMLQIETLDDPLLTKALAAGQIVRSDNVFTAADRAQATALGVQLWQTDWPWDVGRDAANPVVALPGRPKLVASSTCPPVELPKPKAGEAQTSTTAHQISGFQYWQVAFATGLAQGVTPCVAISLAGDVTADGLLVCIDKHTQGYRKPLQDAPPDPLAETRTLSWTVCHNHQCTTATGPALADEFTLQIECPHTCCPNACDTIFAQGWLGKHVNPVALTGATLLQRHYLAQWNPKIDHNADRVFVVERTPASIMAGPACAIVEQQ